MVHPDHIARAEEAEALPLVEPVYPLTAGLSRAVLRNAIGQALGRLPDLPEWQDDELSCAPELSAFARGACAACTTRPTRSMSRPKRSAWRRLAYDEFLAGQLSLALVRAQCAQGCPAGR